MKARRRGDDLLRMAAYFLHTVASPFLSFVPSIHHSCRVNNHVGSITSSDCVRYPSPAAICKFTSVRPTLHVFSTSPPASC